MFHCSIAIKKNLPELAPWACRLRALVCANKDRTNVALSERAHALFAPRGERWAR